MASTTTFETSIGMIPGASWDEHIRLDDIKSPNLCKLFDAEKNISKHLLTALFGETTSLLGNGGNAVNFFDETAKKA